MQWEAAMIAPSNELGSAPFFRREFDLESGHGDVRSALFRVTAFGVFEASINGELVSDEVLAPGWSSYEWRLRTTAYDVSAQLGPTNVIGILVGNGWFRGRLTWTGGRDFYGSERAASAELVVTYSDGYRQSVLTDESWLAFETAVRDDDLYDGQVVDSRLSTSTWQVPGAGGVGHPVRRIPLDSSILVASETPPIRRQEELRVRAVLSSPGENLLVDFGQNLVGWIRLTVSGRRGTEIVVRHAEVLEGGSLSVRPLRTAQATDRYILSGGVDAFEPTFTFHGFRYAEISGLPDDFDIGDVVAIVVHSELERIGTLSCSDPLLNKLHENIVWGMRGNFIGLPTDCPQRDERLGWTGDISVFAATAAYLYNVQGFLADWLVDLGLEQRHNDDIVPSVVPDVLRGVPVPYADWVGTTAIWSDAAVWVPYALWRAYGDPGILTATFDSMVRHIRKVQSLLSPSGLWDTGFQYGDWLDPDAAPDAPWSTKTDPTLVATASAFRTATLGAEVARLLGESEIGTEFEGMAAILRAAFNATFNTEGLISGDSTTGYVLAIVFGLLDENDIVVAGDRLAALVTESGFRITTGFAGTPYICDALSQTGHIAEAYGLLTETSMPSWLYPVTMGATTIWERWDSMLPDGTVNPGEMTSFNHYALGSVADWMHRLIGGIAPLEPGYRRVRIAPKPGGGITFASATLATPRGRIAVDWRVDGDEFHLSLTSPAGVESVVELPDGSTRVVGEGSHDFLSSMPLAGHSRSRAALDSQ